MLCLYDLKIYLYSFESPKYDKTYCFIQTTPHRVVQDCLDLDRMYVVDMDIGLHVLLI